MRGKSMKTRKIYGKMCLNNENHMKFSVEMRKILRENAFEGHAHIDGESFFR